MNEQRSMLRLFSCWLVGGMALAFPLLPQPAVAQDRDLDPDVEKVLRQRLCVLEGIAKTHREAFRAGAAAFTGTLSADLAVLEAKLELATTKAQRVQIREEMLKHAESLEKSAEEMAKAAALPQMKLLEARANRLRAEADLLMERKADAR
jgi:hypothetical protein